MLGDDAIKNKTLPLLYLLAFIFLFVTSSPHIPHHHHHHHHHHHLLLLLPPPFVSAAAG